MDKTKLAMLNGVEKVEVTIPVHGVEVNNNMLQGYLDDGDMVGWSLDKINDCGIRVERPMKVSPEVIRKIKEFAKLNGKGVGMFANKDVRGYNVGSSDYSKHKIQPWDVWREYHLDPWRADIVKRVLRTKAEDGMSIEESQRLDLQKIKHICDELISQIDEGYHF